MVDISKTIFQEHGIATETIPIETHGDALRALLNENGWLSQALPEIQRQRHGVPLHLYTNGLGMDICQHHSDVLGMISTLQVSLWAASPPDYVKSLKEANVAAKASEFGQICNTIATVVEMGVAVHLVIVAMIGVLAVAHLSVIHLAMVHFRQCGRCGHAKAQGQGRKVCVFHFA